MYTVGSPRVLSHGAVAIDSQPCPYYRIVNLFGFQHVGHEVYLTKAGDKGDNPFDEKFLKLLTLWGMIVMVLATMCGIEQKHCSASNPTEHSQDHSGESYRKNLGNIVLTGRD